MVLADTSFLDVLWWMLVVFFWVTVFWVFIVLLGDVITRHDLSGWAKAGWILLLIFVPLIGALIYIATRPPLTERERRRVAEVDADYRAPGYSTAEELARLSDLRQRGVVSEPEYEELKRRVLAAA